MQQLRQKVVDKGHEVKSKLVSESNRNARREKEKEKEGEDAQRKGLLGILELLKSPEKEETDDPFPDMKSIPAEAVQKRWYNWPLKKWEKGTITVKIMPEKFAEGGMRTAHFMVLVHSDGREDRLVAKRQKDGAGSEAYDTDVVMQAACQAVADAFNARKPVKPVQFVDCYVVQRADGSWWGVETYLRGKYRKYNNNYGYVGKDARNTPQAFTHFSYEYTEGKLMIVDVQGVGDHYTDPQVHTMDGKGFGMGNMGVKGMERFMKTHWCNSLCVYLGLEFHTPKKFGVTWHKQPKRDGTAAVGCAGPDGEGMKMADFVGELQAKRGAATPEELALLGLTDKQYGALVTAFNELDRNRDGYLDKEELGQLLNKAKGADPRSKEAEEFVHFAARIEGQVNAAGRVSFKTFILCWTDNL
jgi:hypothetical protein